MNYGCIGERLCHSFSKEVHNRLFDYDYILREIQRDDLDEFMRAKDFKAINVTIPYKESVIPYIDNISDVAKKIGAVNTIVNNNGVLSGFNTDFLGMKALIEYNGINLDNKKVLILGSGGTSKTALAVAESLGAKIVYRVSRTAGNDCITYDDAIELHNDADVIINTTPVGMYPDIYESPINIEEFKKLSAVVDAVYNPLKSKLVICAENAGIKAIGGLYMLVAQAVFAAEKFVEKNIPNSEIECVYKEILSLKQNIVLTGMPGSGKSTIGKDLSKQLNMPFYDTDELIEKRENLRIPEIFEKYGEARFREIESEVIYDISSTQGAVIATGGGAILNRKNIDLLKENGIIFFIDRDINDIVATSDRPLSSNRADLEKRYNERYPLYCERCDKHIMVGNVVEENVEMIKKEFLV